MNTAPLVWGLLHGAQTGLLDLRFEIPSRCAALLRSGDVEIGLVPAIELERQQLEVIAGLGIASNGPVRSILLISRVPLDRILTLAADLSSRTSVVLAQILLKEKYGVSPAIQSAPPNIQAMLTQADACLIIGDPALRAVLNEGLHAVDLGAAWTAWTGLPMVYAVWAARAGFDGTGAAGILRDSWLFGSARIDQIAQAEHAGRSVSFQTARDYLTTNIHFELTAQYLSGLARFRELARSQGFV